MEWRWKKFTDLTTLELYKIIQLRERVFIVEQACVYLDCDDFDQQSWHLSGYQDGELVAYLRVLPGNLRFPEVSFGRVLTSPGGTFGFRRQGEDYLEDGIPHVEMLRS